MSRRGHFRGTSRQRSYLVLEAWPAVDQALWRRINTPGDVFDGGGRAVSWKSRTVKNVLQAYGAWLKWVAAEAPEVFKLPPLERVTRDNVRLYMEALESKPLSPATVQLNLQRLGQAMAAFTETTEFGWLFEAANRLKPVSVRTKRARIVPSYRLAELGFALMRQAEQMPPEWRSPPAAKFRNGLLIAFLAYRPIRVGNLTAMAVGEHITRGENDYVVRFSEDETKQHDMVEFLVPASLTPCFERYLSVYRPMLIGSESHGKQLWISRDGGPMTLEGIGLTICRETKAEFGWSINPHLFRDCAATTIALDDPEHAFAIAAILGHSSLATSEKHYNQARMVEAAKAYHHVLAQARRSHAG